MQLPLAVKCFLKRFTWFTNPTEMSVNTSTWGNWVAAGDDVYVPPSQGGWRYTQQAYDWKSRPTQTTNTDGTTKVISYAAVAALAEKLRQCRMNTAGSAASRRTDLDGLPQWKS